MARRRRTLPLLLLVMVLAAPGAAMASSPDGSSSDLEVWQDPSFQKSFLGSYGTDSDVEPRVTTVERQELEKLLPMMAAEPDRAIEKLKALSTPASSAVFDFTLGNLYFQRDEIDTAATHYRTAIGKFPSFKRAYKNLGLILVRKGQNNEAIGALGKYIELGGADGTTYGLLGYSYSSVSNFVSAESAYRNAVLLDPGTLDWKLGLTQSVYKQRKYGDTLALCDELITAFPNRADFWLLQANTWIGLNQPLKAAEDFEIVRRMGKATLQSLNTLGDIYVNQELYHLAAGVYKEAAETDPHQNPARTLRNVEVLAQRGALDEASLLLTTAKELFGDQFSDDEKKKLLKLESRIAVADGSTEHAAEVLQEIVALDPLDGEALILLGQHYAGIDQPEQAIFYFERAGSLGAYEAEAAVQKAQILVKQSKFREAVPLLKRAQEIRPREDVGHYLDQVERIARAR